MIYFNNGSNISYYLNLVR